jgi:hypothetical protein
MTSTPIRAAATAILGAVLGSGLACTLILSPRDDVERCGNVGDCPSSTDNRYVYECRFDPENTDLDSLNVEKVCVPAHARFGCAIPDNPEDPYRKMFDQRARAVNYQSCSDTPGAQGCPPNQGACNEGLTPRADDGICDDEGSAPRAFGFVPATTDSQAFFGQDVRDQYCRSFYCDDRFVCDTRDNQCRICDPNRALGDGGCGEIYSAGKPMCTYQRGAELDSACAGEGSSVDTIEWGDCTDVDPDPTDGPDDTDDTSDDSMTDETGDDTTTGGSTDETGSTGEGTTGGDETTTG